MTTLAPLSPRARHLLVAGFILYCAVAAAVAYLLLPAGGAR